MKKELLDKVEASIKGNPESVVKQAFEQSAAEVIDLLEGIIGNWGADQAVALGSPLTSSPYRPTARLPSAPRPARRQQTRTQTSRVSGETWRTLARSSRLTPAVPDRAMVRASLPASGTSGGQCSSQRVNEGKGME